MERMLSLMSVRLTGRIALVAHLAAPEHAGLLPVLRGLPQSDSQVSNPGLVVGPPPTAMHICMQTGISSPCRWCGYLLYRHRYGRWHTSPGPGNAHNGEGRTAHQ